jgi:uncharacterized integral membrane protein
MDDERAMTDGATTTDRRDQDEALGTGVTRYLVAIVVLALLFVVLAAQNSQRVAVDLFVWQPDPPMYAVAFVSALLGALATIVGSAVWRHRRRQLIGERRAAARDDRPAPESAPAG